MPHFTNILSPMRPVIRVLTLWLAGVALMLLSFVFPHHDVEIVSVVSNSVQLLLFITSVYLVRHETVNKTKYIFLNFAALFSLFLLFHAGGFIGKLFLKDEPLASFLYYQYVSEGLYVLLFAIAICYVTIDVLFRDFKTVQKYFIAFLIAGGFFAYYYYPMFENKLFLYETDDIVEWKELDLASAEFRKEYSVNPTEQQLTSYMTGTHAPHLFQHSEAERVMRIAALFPFLAEENYMTLLVKPLNLNGIYMSVLCVGLILLFFGYLYKKDPPQGAYIEKMMFFFLMLASLEVFHNWSLVKIVEWESSLQIIQIGEILSAAVLCMIALFFILRLRFITTVYGEFYEHEIAERPTAITRWRDAFDNYVIAHFFNRNELVGRFFVNPKWRNETNA